MAVLSPSEKVKLLGSAPLFAGLSPRELEALGPVARRQTLDARKQLFHKGDEGAQIYLVISGRLKALTTSHEGDDVVFSIVGPGEVIGEIALFCNSGRTATVVAIDACELLCLDRRDFIAFLRSHPDAAIKLLGVLGERTKNLSELVEDTLFLNLPLRLAKKLIGLSRLYGEEIEAGVRVDLKLSQEEWGDLVGATRESINKQVRAWTEEGLITVDRGYIIIHREADLEKLASAVVF